MTDEQRKQFIEEQIEIFPADCEMGEFLRDIAKLQSCEDAISRTAVLNTLDTMDKALDENRTVEEYKELLRECYEQLPSINVAEKTGRWITQDIHNCHTDFKCSECGYIHSFMHLYGEPTADYTYCPNCGAKMEVKK